VGRTLVVSVAVLLGAVAACSGGDGVAGPSDSDGVATPADPSGTSATTPATTTPGTAPSSTAPSSTAPPETAVPSSTPTFDFTEVSAIVDGFVDDRGLNGAGLAIVHREHGLVHHEHWGEFDPDRVSLIASSSKMIVAGVLLRLQDDGLLDVDAPVAEIVEWGEGNPDITPAQLVSNSSGLVGLGPVPEYGPYVCQWSPTDEIERCAAEIFTTEADDGDVIAPDTQFRYGGAQWQIAGAVAEVASGRSWAELIEEIYVGPCGVESLAFNNHFAQLGPGGFVYPSEFDGDTSLLIETANPNMEGGAYITSGDYAELLLMHLRDGLCDGGRVLSPDALDRLHADRIGDVYGGSAGVDTGYGMGWWVDRTTGRLTDPGAYGTVPWLDLEDGSTGLELAGLLYGPVDEILGGR
jgi:CubicO group peptidase (beta-lactamase class C family)